MDVESLDAALKRVEESGGRVAMPKTQIGEHGFYALISDTEGNTVGFGRPLPKNECKMREYPGAAPRFRSGPRARVAAPENQNARRPEIEGAIERA